MIPVEKICELSRILVGDGNHTKFSDFEVSEAVDSAVRMLVGEMVVHRSPLLLKTVRLQMPVEPVGHHKGRPHHHHEHCHHMPPPPPVEGEEETPPERPHRPVGEKALPDGRPCFREYDRVVHPHHHHSHEHPRRDLFELPADFIAVGDVRQFGRSLAYDPTLEQHESYSVEGHTLVCHGWAGHYILQYFARPQYVESPTGMLVPLPDYCLDSLARMTSHLLGGDYTGALELATSTAISTKVREVNNYKLPPLFGGYNEWA